MAKKVPASEWERMSWAWSELAEKRGEALSRVWMVVETQVNDAGLANELRMAIVGDFIPAVSVYENDAEEVEEDEE